MVKHTPGPWTLERTGNTYAVQAKTWEDLARIYCTNDEPEPSEGTANASLIAAAPDLLAILDELEGSFDEQTYQEKAREDFDAPNDREYSVNITAKQLRAISRALLKAQITPAANVGASK